MKNFDFYGIMNKVKRFYENEVSIVAEKKEKRYVSDNAQLMSEWDWEKNKEFNLYPDQITCGITI